MRDNDSLNARTLLLCGQALLGLLLAACGQKEDTAPAQAPAQTQAPVQPAPQETAAADDSDEAEAPDEPGSGVTAKLNTYIDCFNSSYGRAHDAMSRYQSWVKDMKAGPTGKERVIYGTYTVPAHVLAGCAEPVLQATAAQPSLPALDAAAREYSSTLAAWGKTLFEADKYYEREDYKDDGMAKGRSLHAAMVRDYEAYRQATERFNSALEAENDKLQQQELAEIEKTQGRKFAYWHGLTMFKAKKAAELLGGEPPDLPRAQAQLKEFEDAADGLGAYAKEPGADKPMMWAMFEDQVEQFRIAAKQRLRAVRDRQAPDSASGEGSSGHMVEAYNELVQGSNQLR